MTRVCRAGASPEQVQVRLSVVRTGTATVSTGMEGLYLATRRAVEPPRVNTMIREACTCSIVDRPVRPHRLQMDTDTLNCPLQTTLYCHDGGKITSPKLLQGICPGNSSLFGLLRENLRRNNWAKSVWPDQV